MANKKISELATASALTGAELVEVVQGGANVKTTTQDIADLGSGGGGTGDVAGPASSVDNDIVLFNGVTGKLIKDSGVLLSAKEDVANKATALTTMNNTLYPSTASLFDERQVTGVDSVVQSDNGKTIYFNSASPFNFTIDSLTIKSKVAVINVGSGVVTFVNGSGVTYSGATTLAANESGMILYKSSTSPIIRSSTVVPTATSSTPGISKLYTTTGSNTDGSMDQNSITNALTLKWSLSNGGTLTGVNTLTSNTMEQFIFTGAPTTTANNQSFFKETETITSRATASDVMYHRRLQPTFVATANSQNGVILDLNGTFTAGAFTGTSMSALRVTNGSTNVFQIENTGNILFKDTGGTTRMSWSATSGALIGDNATTQINPLNETNGWSFLSGSKTSTGSMFSFRSAQNTITSGNPLHWITLSHSGLGFNPTSGASDLNLFNVAPIINQTSTASGNITLMDYNPTLTAILGANYGFRIRPADTKSGFSVGSTAPSAKVMIGASSTAAGTASLKIVEGSRQTSPEDGTINYVSNNLEFVETSTVYTLAKTLTNTATLDFGNTAAGASTDLTITVTGAVDGDPVVVGVPNASTVANGIFTAWVSASNTVTVRFTNSNLVTALDPASGTFRVSVIHY